MTHLRLKLIELLAKLRAAEDVVLPELVALRPLQNLTDPCPGALVEPVESVEVLGPGLGALVWLPGWPGSWLALSDEAGEGLGEL